MAAEKSKRPERKRTGQLSGLQIMFAAILAIGLILGLNFTNLVSSGQPLQQKYNQLKTEITNLEREQVDLIRERDFVQSDAYVETWAHDEGKMVLPGQTLVIPVPPGSLAEATPEPQPEIAIETTSAEPKTGNFGGRSFLIRLRPSFDISEVTSILATSVVALPPSH